MSDLADVVFSVVSILTVSAVHDLIQVARCPFVEVKFALPVVIPMLFDDSPFTL